MKTKKILSEKKSLTLKEILKRTNKNYEVLTLKEEKKYADSILDNLNDH